MNGFAARVRRAPNIQDAVILLAEAADQILDQLALQGAQDTAWTNWGTTQGSMSFDAPATLEQATAIMPGHGSAERPAERNDKLAAELREKLAVTSDGEERRALEAALRLAEEDGIVPADNYADAGTLTTLRHDEETDTVLIDLPAPDPTRYSQRKQWAKQVRLGTMFQPAMDENVAAHAYAQGGPLWLYHGNDELVRNLPLQWRQMMVNDIEHDSPMTAQVVARDILKHDSEDAMGDAPTLGSLTGELS